MGKTTQVAFQIDDRSLRGIDELAAGQASSRAAVLRTAVHELLAAQREASIDAQLAAGYGAQPPGAEDEAWTESSLEGLRAADLDW
ncbi:MAG: ribbon-helix-helix protein, CopG family [Solirubrobacteraceae bacterium]